MTSPGIVEPDLLRQTGSGAASTHKAAYKMAVANGVKIALGTDLGLGGVCAPVRQRGYSVMEVTGRNWLVYAVEAGMNALGSHDGERGADAGTNHGTQEWASEGRLALGLDRRQGRSADGHRRPGGRGQCDSCLVRW